MLDEYTFVCAPNGARTAAVTYTADYPIELVLPCIGNGVILGYHSSGAEISGKYEYLDYKSGEAVAINDPAWVYFTMATRGIENNKSYSTMINGHTIPHPQYTNGTDWNRTYSSAFGSGSECYAFGLFIYEYLFGDAGIKVQVSASKSQSFFEELARGTSLRCTFKVYKSDGSIAYSDHTMILLECNASGMYVYHANWVPNKVTISFIDWDTVNDRIVSVDYFICPHNISEWMQYNDSYHRGICTICNNSIFMPHYSRYPEPANRCHACGYIGDMNGTTRTGEPLA